MPDDDETNVYDIAKGRRMSERDYENKRDELRALYGDSSAEAKAKRDQALAALFYGSGWTQEELAKKEGMSRRRMGERLLFGRFLFFGATAPKSNSLPKGLTENRFYTAWKRTDPNGNERQRFIQALRLIEAERSIRNGAHTGHGPKIMSRFADGKWHLEDEIVSGIDADAGEIRRTLDKMRDRGEHNSKVETKKVGGKLSYRIFKQDKTVSSHELTEKLTPFIEELKVESKKSMATISFSAIARLAVLLQRQLDEWNA